MTTKSRFAQGRPCPPRALHEPTPKYIAAQSRVCASGRGVLAWQPQEAQGDELLSGSWHILGGAITAAAVERQ